MSALTKCTSNEERSLPGVERTRPSRIKDWPQDDRPREKLLRHGPVALSDAELLAIIIRTGSRGKSALDLARTVLSGEKNLRSIGGRSVRELMRLKGIGMAKAVELIAVFEIGRRAQAGNAEEKVIIRSPEDVARRMLPKLRDRNQEGFHVLVLDSKNGLKVESELSRGILNASLVHPREVFKVAIDNMGASVIVVHNHPSGNPEPSKEDMDITRQLADAGKILGIPLHDHVIIAGDGYTSFAERGLL